MTTPYIIAEAGVNHNGSLDMALQLIDAAAQAGADAVKFQTFKSEAVISRFAEKADYQKSTTGNTESQLDMVRKLELDLAAHKTLLARCQQRNIQFLSTPFDLGSVDLLVQQLDVPMLKVPSGEITNAPLLLKVAQTQKPVILSTGMSTLADVEAALAVFAFAWLQTGQAPSEKRFAEAFLSPDGQALLRQRVTLLHCTTEYPAPFADVNLRAMETLRAAFGLAVGYSDHTEGIAVSVAAAALGATMIEKHFTLDRNLPGPDHRASLEPDELTALVSSVRQVSQALGTGAKIPAPSELKNRDIARKSLVAARALSAGDILTEDNLTTKRPGHGISPMRYWQYLGTKVGRDYREDETL